MKLREGFVSNSSSASFILFKKYLTEDQIEKILECNEKELIAKRETETKSYEYDECWHIKDEGEIITGFATMDNDILYEIIHEMNPPMKAILAWDRD